MTEQLYRLYVFIDAQFPNNIPSDCEGRAASELILLTALFVPDEASASEHRTYIKETTGRVD